MRKILPPESREKAVRAVKRQQKRHSHKIRWFARQWGFLWIWWNGPIFPEQTSSRNECSL